MSHGSSRDSFYRVTNDDVKPTHPVRVTLRHIYQKLGKTLEDWPQWPLFVKHLPKTLLEEARVSREQLLADAQHLKAIDVAIKRRQKAESLSRPPQTYERSPWEDELMKWLSGLPYPWCTPQQAILAMPHIGEMAPVKRYLESIRSDSRD